MFGYVKPFKPELKVKEFETYKAVYCGLCHEMGRHYGPFSRFTLSYDFTFAALLGMALASTHEGFEDSRCMAHPLKKRPRAKSCGSLTMVSGLAMAMLHQKVRDNIADSSFFKVLFCRMVLPFTKRMNRKATAAYPEAGEALEEMMERQFALEQKPDSSIDAAAEPTAAAMGKMIALLSEDETEKRILSRMGYLLGRWVYLIDALDDLSDDAKECGFNPFLRRFDPEGKWNGKAGIPPEKLQEMLEFGTGMLNITVGELASAYELLELKRYKPILDNIIYMGLSASVRQVREHLSGQKPGKKTGLLSKV